MEERERCDTKNENQPAKKAQNNTISCIRESQILGGCEKELVHMWEEGGKIYRPS